MAALSCLLDSVRRDIKKVDRELRQLRCIDEFSTRCLCDLYMHPYCCCDLHPYPYCLCYSKRSRSCGLCDLYPCCLCDVKLYCLRPSLRSLERKAIRAIEDEKRELAKWELPKIFLIGIGASEAGMAWDWGGRRGDNQYLNKDEMGSSNDSGDFSQDLRKMKWVHDGNCKILKRQCNDVDWQGCFRLIAGVPTW